jgi:hypothetical protein
MGTRGRTSFLLAAVCSFGIAALHVAIVIVGPSAYRYFGAPGLGDLVERGSVLGPTLLTLAVAVLFALWGAYALAGAGMVRRLPLLRAAVVTIAAIYLLRGLPLLTGLVALARGTLPYPRALAFSGASLFTGLCYLAGTVRAWPALGGGAPRGA